MNGRRNFFAEHGKPKPMVSVPLKSDTNYLCPKCRVPRSLSDKFCGNCGAARFFVFVFGSSMVFGYVTLVITDSEEKAWSALGNKKRLSEKDTKSIYKLTLRVEIPF
jgi:hypothetical protein